MQLRPQFRVLDLDECSKGLHNCGNNARCENIVGSYLCQCNNGFIGNGQTCLGKQSVQKPFGLFYGVHVSHCRTV